MSRNIGLRLRFGRLYLIRLSIQKQKPKEIFPNYFEPLLLRDDAHRGIRTPICEKPKTPLCFKDGLMLNDDPAVKSKSEHVGFCSFVEKRLMYK